MTRACDTGIGTEKEKRRTDLGAEGRRGRLREGCELKRQRGV